MSNLPDPVRRMLDRNCQNREEGLIPPEPEHVNPFTGQAPSGYEDPRLLIPAPHVTNQELAEKLERSLNLSRTLGILSDSEYGDLRAGAVLLDRGQLDNVRSYVNYINAFHQEVDILPEQANHLIKLCCNSNVQPELLEAIFIRMFEDLGTIEDRLTQAHTAGRINARERAEIETNPIAFERMTASLGV